MLGCVGKDNWVLLNGYEAGFLNMHGDYVTFEYKGKVYVSHVRYSYRRL